MRKIYFLLVGFFLFVQLGCSPKGEHCKRKFPPNREFIYFYEPHSKTCFVAFSDDMRYGTHKVPCSASLIEEARADSCFLQSRKRNW